ncbi:MAG TPA: nucleotidyltransferase domain-containing protein [Candidatus Nanoarchaeia archaeon]|nr:nucleotidyltransferase domain-containing protein [Candidatus Nanoarchaeia archaeon]
MVKKIKKTDVKEFKEAYQKVLFWFFSFPTREIGLSDLSETVGIAKSTANKIVTTLVNEQFLNLEFIGRVWRISCKQDHIYNFSKKISYNLMMVYESGILQEIHRRIPNLKAVILFGSYRKGDDTEKSDIDIAVEVAGDQEIKIESLGILQTFGYRKDVQVNLHIFSRNKIDINLFSNIANGILLEGFLEVRP